MPVLTKRRSIAALAGGLIVVFAVVAAGSLRAGTACSISWLANDFGLELASASSVRPDEVQSFSTKVHEQYPTATIDESEEVAIKSGRLPPLNGHDVLLFRLGNLPPEEVGAPAGEQPPSLDVFCAMSVYDSGTGAFMVTLKAFGDEPNTAPSG